MFVKFPFEVNKISFLSFAKPNSTLFPFSVSYDLIPIHVMNVAIAMCGWYVIHESLTWLKVTSSTSIWIGVKNVWGCGVRARPRNENFKCLHLQPLPLPQKPKDRWRSKVVDRWPLIWSCVCLQKRPNVDLVKILLLLHFLPQMAISWDLQMYVDIQKSYLNIMCACVLRSKVKLRDQRIISHRKVCIYNPLRPQSRWRSKLVDLNQCLMQKC